MISASRNGKHGSSNGKAAQAPEAPSEVEVAPEAEVVEEETPVVDVKVEKKERHVPVLKGLKRKETSLVSKRRKAESKRDERSRLVNRLVSKHIPPMSCNTCVMAGTGKCPLYAPGKECAFTAVVEGHAIADEGDVREAMMALLEVGMQRIQFAVIMERLNGNAIDPELTKMMGALGFIGKDILGNTRDRGTVGGAPATVTVNLVGSLFGGADVDKIKRPRIEVPYDDVPVLEEDRQERKELADVHRQKMEGGDD